MTLIVSLRTPDGIVIAGDSLLVLMRQDNLDHKIDVTCPECNHTHEMPNRLSMAPVPATTFSYTQKVFPFCGKFGVGIFQTGIIANKPVYSAIRSFEQSLNEQEVSAEGVTEIAEKIRVETYNLLKEQLEQEKTSMNTLSDDLTLLGFQVVGYDGTEPKMIEISLGKNARSRTKATLGCTVSGSQEIVQAIWNLHRKDPNIQPPYSLFSLQDGIDYAEFLIQTTIAYQRFSRMIPNVGGDIDIAVITPFDGFQWIRQKPSSKILEGK